MNTISYLISKQLPYKDVFQTLSYARVTLIPPPLSHGQAGSLLLSSIYTLGKGGSGAVSLGSFYLSYHPHNYFAMCASLLSFITLLLGCTHDAYAVNPWRPVHHVLMNRDGVSHGQGQHDGENYQQAHANGYNTHLGEYSKHDVRREYGAPASGYSSPSNEYNAPISGYSEPLSSYDAPSRGHSSPPSVYGSPSNEYDAPSRGYSSPTSGYDEPQSSYVAHSSGYSSPSREYSAPSSGYSSPSSGYGEP